MCGGRGWDNDGWKAGCRDNRGNLINVLAEADHYVGVVAKFGVCLLEALDEIDGEEVHVYIARVGCGCAAPVSLITERAKGGVPSPFQRGSSPSRGSSRHAPNSLGLLSERVVHS